MKKRIIALILSIFYLFSLTSCWNYREIEDLLIVAGVAIDRGTNGERYHLTIELAKIASGAQMETTTQSQLIEVESDTIFNGVRKAVQLTGKKLYWSNCQIIIISKDIARDGIAPILDFFIRDAEPRLNIEPIISADKTAKEVIAAQSPIDPIHSFAIDKEIENNQSNLSSSQNISLYRTYDVLAGEGKSLTLPAVRLINSEGNLTQIVDSLAIFKGDKLIGFLNQEDSTYLNYITDNVKGGILVVSEDRKNDIALEIFESNTSLKHEIINGKIYMNININTTASLGEENTSTNFIDEEGRNKLKKDAEQRIRQETARVIDKVQKQYDSDVFGFGSCIYKSDPKLWKQLKPQWDQMFKNMQFIITANVNIRNSALLRKTVKAGD